MESSTLSLKLLVHRDQRKVFLAEVGRDVVDFLFSILALPMGQVVRHLTKEEYNMVGCLGKLYQSVENLDEAEVYLQSDQTMSSLLTPMVASPALPVGAALFWNSYDPYAPPPAVTESGSSGGEGGGLVNCAAYIVMDDLEVVPLSTKTVINLLREFGVQDLDSVYETTVELGTSEALKILKASLQSHTVLTDVFLSKN